LLWILKNCARKVTQTASSVKYSRLQRGAPQTDYAKSLIAASLGSDLDVAALA
jgi:hypothetical protein